MDIWEQSNADEKKFNAETHRVIGEAQLRQFGSFLEKYNESTIRQETKFRNIYNVSAQLILLDNQASVENEPISELIHSDNKILSRIIATLGAICNEIICLVAEAEAMYPHFILYVDTFNDSSKHLSVCNILELLQKVYGFVKRVQQVVILTLKQLCAILGKKIYVSSISAFPEIFHNLGDLLVCLLKFDSVLDQQILKDHWFLYRKSVRNITYATKYNISRNQLTVFDKNLLLFENELLMGQILKNTIDKCFEDKDLNSQMKNCSLNQEFYAFISYLLSELEKDEENINQQFWWKLNIFVVFYSSVFENADKKLRKRLLDLNKRVSSCSLIGNIMWYPEQFLLKHLPSLEKHIDEKAVESYRLNLIHSKSSNFPRESNLLCLQVCYFLVELGKIAGLNTNNINAKQLQNIIIVFTSGLKLMERIGFSIKWLLNICADKDLPVNKSVLLAVCKLIEVLKCIVIIFDKNMITMNYIVLITQHLSHKAISVLHGIRKKFTQEKSYKEHELDVLSALNLCEQTLKRSSSNRSILIANLALSASGLSSTNLVEMRSVLTHLETLANFLKTVRETGNCFFLYWHQNYMLPVYFSKLISSKSDLSRYYLILNALSDTIIPMTEEKVTVMVNKIIKDTFYEPLEQIIEVNLRLQTHLHLQLPPMDPFENYFPINFNKYLPVPMSKLYKSIKNEAEHHLSKEFYNLTSVVLHDWRTYGEMRRLAHLQYGLVTVDDNLPMQTLEQGLDVLEIMRNINVFVSRYLYNLNTQVFIESHSDNKHLNSINISHVANSIRTHGIGIMNTTVNFTYQFLSNKFHIFSQFLFDEHIKSRLIKDIRFFSERKVELNHMYPYERADKFNVGIKKLGLNEKGESYLDLFRQVITHIGNAMGYVRLIRSGGRRCLADSTCFIPDLKSRHLNDIVEKDDMPEVTAKATTVLLSNLQMFLDNMEDATEYFQLLVKVFEPVLRSKTNVHLRNFYVIVPPLTVNFVEHSLNCKEKLHKRNKAEYIFSDDGFALGLAYIIEILNQGEHLNSLQWFQSVQRKFDYDRMKIDKQTNAADNHDIKLKQTLALTDKKISSYEKEFRLLYFSFNSARLFFQT